MALSLKDPEIEKRARRLAKRRSTTMTTVIRDALRNEERREDESIERTRFAIALSRAREMIRSGPIDWSLTEDEILGYDENGVPEQPR